MHSREWCVQCEDEEEEGHLQGQSVLEQDVLREGVQMVLEVLCPHPIQNLLSEREEPSGWPEWPEHHHHRERGEVQVEQDLGRWASQEA